jgi:hypothetical protein
MWMDDKIIPLLKILISNTFIGEIIIIDNNPQHRKKIPNSSKILIIQNNQNNFVNPSWNIGYTLSKYELILCNDDIEIRNLNGILNVFMTTDYDVLGVGINENNGDMFIEDYKQEPTNNFGCFMYIKKYNYIPEKYKIFIGDNFLKNSNKKVGIVKNSSVFTEKSGTLKKIPHLRNTIGEMDKKLYLEEKKSDIIIKQKVLFVLVNYGHEQIEYLEKVVNEINKFEKYETKIILHSNIDTKLSNIDETIIFNKMSDYQLLPLTCRKTIWDNRENYDVFVYGENDMLFKEHHIDKHIEYSKILPKNRIPGLLRFEEDETGIYFPDYHAKYEWDFKSLEIHDNKKFAFFTNLHQATFILTKEQLLTIGKEHDFNEFFSPSHYSVKCKVCTDLYQFTSYKKLICISEFKNNIIHHMSNVYIHGNKGRRKNQRSDFERMKKSILYLMDFNKENYSVKENVEDYIKIEIEKNERREIMKDFSTNKKTIDYDKINELSKIVVGYNVNSSKKPPREVMVNKREEINELRKDSLAKIARDLSKTKQNRKR